MSNRELNEGNPPHIGWWNATNGHVNEAWRWWNGECWSDVVFEDDPHSDAELNEIASTPGDSYFPVCWTNYWPDNARVPRIDPSKQ